MYQQASQTSLHGILRVQHVLCILLGLGSGLTLYADTIWLTCVGRCGLTVSALCSESSVLGSSPCHGHCIMFLREQVTVLSHFLSPPAAKTVRSPLFSREIVDGDR